jgi:hypothetical protein
MPLGPGLLPPLPMPAPGPPPSSAPIALPAPRKPGWQLALDGALLAIGRKGDALARWYRSSPQSTRIGVVVGASAVALLMLSALLFVVVR